jgi:hypothetical protein
MCGEITMVDHRFEIQLKCMDELDACHLTKMVMEHKKIIALLSGSF